MRARGQHWLEFLQRDIGAALGQQQPRQQYARTAHQQCDGRLLFSGKCRPKQSLGLIKAPFGLRQQTVECCLRRCDERRWQREDGIEVCGLFARVGYTPLQ